MRILRGLFDLMSYPLLDSGYQDLIAVMLCACIFAFVVGSIRRVSDV